MKIGRSSPLSEHCFWWKSSRPWSRSELLLSGSSTVWIQLWSCLQEASKRPPIRVKMTTTAFRYLKVKKSVSIVLKLSLICPQVCFDSSWSLFSKFVLKFYVCKTNCDSDCTTLNERGAPVSQRRRRFRSGAPFGRPLSEVRNPDVRLCLSLWLENSL